jgi:hypothetical protein
MNSQFKNRFNRIDNKLLDIKRYMSRNLGNVDGLSGPTVCTPLKGNNLDDFDFVDIDEQIDNIKDANDAIRVKNLLFKQMENANKMYSTTDKFMIMGDRDRRDVDIYDESKAIEALYRNKVINYIAAILDPEYNYSTGIMVKQPSLMNPPSVSIPIKTLTTIPSEGYSSICIAWNPTMFCTTNMLSKIQLGVDVTNNNAPIYANKICSVVYSLGELENGVLTVPPSSWQATVRGIPDNLPEVGIAKARLVSSKIKISFRGPILNQGGTIMAAATFQGPPGIICKSGDDNRIKTNTQQENATWADLFKISLGSSFNDKEMSPFEEKVISNGIWAKNVNITKDANGITAIFIPTDPMDEIFCKPGTFYGEKVDNPNYQCNGPYATSCLYSDKGARLNYLFNIQGIPGDNTNPITVETYTTWEVIPTNLSASTLRNSASVIDNTQYYQTIKQTISNLMQTNTGIQPTDSEHNLNGLFSNIKRAISGAWDYVRPVVHKLTA